MFRALIGRKRSPEHIYTPYLQELGIFWVTPGFHDTDRERLFNNKINRDVVRYAVDRYGDDDLGRVNAASVTRKDAEALLRLLKGNPTVPWWCSALLAEELHNGAPRANLARKYGLDVRRMMQLAEMGRGKSML